MAVTLPVLGLKPVHSSCCSHRLAPTSSVSYSVGLPSLCRVRSSQLSGSNRVSASRPLGRDGITSNSGRQLSELDVVSVVSGNSVEHCLESGRAEPLLLERVCRGSVLAVAGSLMSAGASLADEVTASVVDGSDVGISTTVSVLFVVATVGLVVLTGGVVYLGLTEFLEKRAIQEEQKKVEESKPKKPTKQAVKAAARAGGPKGFGSSKRTKGDDEEISN